MKRLLLSLLLLPLFVAAEPPLWEGGHQPSVNDPDLKLQTLIYSTMVRDAGFAEAFEDVITCVRQGGRAGLAAGRDGQRRPVVSIACEYGVPAHDPYVYGVTITQAHIDAYNQNFRTNVGVVGDQLGWGPGSPTAGLPSPNFIVIGPDATRTVRQIIWERDTPTWPCP